MNTRDILGYINVVLTGTPPDISGHYTCVKRILHDFSSMASLKQVENTLVVYFDGSQKFEIRSMGDPLTVTGGPYNIIRTLVIPLDHGEFVEIRKSNDPPPFEIWRNGCRSMLTAYNGHGEKLRQLDDYQDSPDESHFRRMVLSHYGDQFLIIKTK